jgi:branched-chain amino acid transport system ATP-binding protein
MLSIKDLEVSYGHISALEGVSIEVPKGQIVSIIGSNGAGKSTMLNTISGVVKAQKGKIYFKGEELISTPHKIVKKGLVQVPEGRKVFAGLTVRENLVMGGYPLKSKHEVDKNIDKMFDLFERLRERKDQQAGTLSGGEQQMLAIARGLMSNPELILLDEPSLGLAPVIVKTVYKLITDIKEMGITVVLVEQNAKAALAASDYGYVLENGKVVLEGKGSRLLCDPSIKKAYLGDAQ